MNDNKTILSIVVTTVILIGFIAWTFFAFLKSDSQQGNVTDTYPQKEVMVSANAMQTAHLDELAQKGHVAEGMSMAQVKLAKGEPARIETNESESTNSETIWWYQHEGWMSIVFNNKGKVSRIEHKH